MNSVYGALGSQYFRFFDIRLALAVTLGSQLSIRWVADRLNLYMNKTLNTDNVDFIIASDTDSVYLRLGELVKKVYSVDDVTDIDVHKMINFMDKVCESKIKPLIDKSFDELFVYTRAYQQKMQMKREALANKGIWTAKKRYILNVYNNEGVAYNEPEIKVMGLEMVKSSTPMKVRVTMKEMLKIIMNGKESDLHQFVKDFKSEFYKLPAEDISFPRGLNNLGKYSDALNLYKSGTPIHVRGAILYNNFLIKNELDKKYELIKEGEKVKFVYLKLPNHFKDDIISFPVRLPKEFNLDKYIDYKKQFEKSFISPIEVILNCIGWKSKKVLTLESFTKKR
jgi:DNA polymerase elongation subunit (family B)